MTWIVTFSGAREGMTPEQRKQVASVLDLFAHSADEVRDSVLLRVGMCVGADAEVVALVGKLERGPYVIDIEGHPAFHRGHPMRSTARQGSYLRVLDVVPPLTRNRTMLAGADLLIAAPADKGSRGTWYTINHARRTDVRTVVVRPDGSVKQMDPLPNGGRRQEAAP